MTIERSMAILDRILNRFWPDNLIVVTVTYQKDKKKNTTSYRFVGLELKYLRERIVFAGSCKRNTGKQGQSIKVTPHDHLELDDDAPPSDADGGSRNGFSCRACSSNSPRPRSRTAFCKHHHHQPTPKDERKPEASKPRPETTHLHTFLVLGPDGAAFLLKLFRLLLGVLVSLALRDIPGVFNGRLEISLKPSIETRVVRVLEGCTFR